MIAYEIIKASSSVATNYKAVCRAKSRVDFINKLKLGEEEADESLFWLEFIADAELNHQPTSARLNDGVGPTPPECSSGCRTNTSGADRYQHVRATKLFWLVRNY